MQSCSRPHLSASWLWSLVSQIEAAANGPERLCRWKPKSNVWDLQNERMLFCTIHARELIPALIISKMLGPEESTSWTQLNWLGCVIRYSEVCGFLGLARPCGKQGRSGYMFMIPNHTTLFSYSSPHAVIDFILITHVSHPPPYHVTRRVHSGYIYGIPKDHIGLAEMYKLNRPLRKAWT